MFLHGSPGQQEENGHHVYVVYLDSSARTYLQIQSLH
jgi:hypothetical protein